MKIIDDQAFQNVKKLKNNAQKYIFIQSTGQNTQRSVKIKF